MPYDIILGRDNSDKKKFGKDGLIYIGKGYVTMGAYTSLSNNLYLDVARSHVILIAGKRGSGKSYSIGVIAEEIANLEGETSRNLASLIFDTMGIFWTMKFKNEKESSLLAEWNLETKPLAINVFVPYGKSKDYQEKNIPFDSTFALLPSELDIDDWISTFNVAMTSQEGVLISNVISALKKSHGIFTIQEIQREISHNSQASHEVRNIVSSLFQAAQSWGIFSQSNEGTNIDSLVTAGKTTILDLSVYSSIGSFNVRALVISLISRKLFSARMEARKQEEIQALQHGTEYLAHA